MRFFKIFRVNKNRNGDKFSRGTFFLKLQISFGSFLNRHHHTTANASTATNNTTKTTHTNTNKHNQTQTNTDTSHISSTKRPTSFQVARGLHSFYFDTNKFGRTGKEPKYRHWQVRAVCAQRESPTGRVIIVIVAERRERRQEREERREREKRREKEREENPPSSSPPPTTPPPFPPLRVYAQNVSVCRFKTPPCMPAKTNGGTVWS